MDVNSTINYCKSLSFYDLQDFAGRNYQKVYNWFDGIDRKSGMTPNQLLISTIFVCIAVDDRMTEDEWMFVVSFIGGYSYEEARYTAASLRTKESQEIVKKFYDAFPYDISEAYLNLCIAILCVDQDFDAYERTFLRTLIS